MRYIWILLFLSAIFEIFTVVDVSMAEEPSIEKKTKKQTLNFEDELVEGATAKPDLFFLFQKKNFNYSRLIKLRENFIPEMKRTSEDLYPVRREN